MDAVKSAPALPWAVPEKAEAPAAHGPEEADVDPAPITIAQLGLSAGSRIQVQWLVEPDEGEPYVRWWGATLEEGETMGPAGPSYQLKYDAQEGFEEEHRAVYFLSNHVLSDIAQEDDSMFWRLEGDSYEPPDTDDEGEDAMPEVLTCSDLQRLAGPPDANPNVLVEGSAYQQRQAADALQEFAGHLKSFMAVRMDQKRAAGEDTIVTKDDADEFISIMRSTKRSRA